MTVNSLAKLLGDASYVFLTLNFFWGLFCTIVVWRKLRELRFRTERMQLAFVEELNEYVTVGDYDSAITMCESDLRALPQLASLVLTNRDLEPTSLRQLVTERLQQVIVPLENRVNWIITVIRNGPLLGLFGTVLGMMAAFGRIGMGEKVQPSQIADEISVALICTAMGLGTAIPLGYVASSLNIRIRALQESITPTMLRLLNTFRTMTTV
jgi:biopolymer transport protein ExbB/TolQ